MEREVFVNDLQHIWYTSTYSMEASCLKGSSASLLIPVQTPIDCIVLKGGIDQSQNLIE